MLTLLKFMEKINTGEKNPPRVKYGEPMSLHTTFRVGGPADVWVSPEKEIFPAYAAKLLKAAGEEGIPVFILGAGANLVVSDRGIRGIVLDTGAFQGIGKRDDRQFARFDERVIERIRRVESPGEFAALQQFDRAKGQFTREKPHGEKEFEALQKKRENSLFSVSVLAGTPVDLLASRLAGRGLSGAEFLAGMPGSVGGAVWMNARCYEKSVSDILLETEILDENFERQKVPFRPEDFSYKKSPFQNREVLILSARFALRFRDSRGIRKENTSHRRDRAGKGHYRFPSAGSAFKNNRAFGEPTGRIIDQLGLRGFTIGGAQIAPWHGNIIINTGNALADDIKLLMDETARRVKAERGFDLESEIIFAGEWPSQ